MPLSDFVKEQALRVAGRLFRAGRSIDNALQDREKRKHCIVMEGAVLYPQSKVRNFRERGSIVIGEHSQLLACLENRGHGGTIRIGKYCFISENTYIWSAASVTIGDRVLISHGVNIHDTNSHALSAESRHQHSREIFLRGHPPALPDVRAEPIVIEDDAWIGFGSTILKGVRIGKGAVVGACSMVTKDVEPYTIVIGNPARPIGRSQP